MIPPNTKFSVAIPASLASDTPHLREKTGKLGFIARACSIFGIREIVIYTDEWHRDQKEDIGFCADILRFAETPQYLRKRMFRITPNLRFTGILPPLQTPPHNVPDSFRDVKAGDLREGVVIGHRDGASLVEAGLARPLFCAERIRTGDRVTVRIIDDADDLKAEIVDESKISIYWGYQVREAKSGLAGLLEKEKYDLTIGTSRFGTSILNVWSNIENSLRHVGRVLVVFGSPRRGLREILAQEGKKPEEVFDFFVNTVPNQNVSTVRTEEALLATLSILNVMRIR